ncbi:MAG: hypothetical protein IJ990_08320 [Alistipes sp.]|nr:hypothetical protein [Alistipes sp.]
MRLLLPYAYNSDGERIHIDDARRGQKYTCPNPDCGAELLLRIGKIKRKHFAHKVNFGYHCTETVLHKLFKDKCEELIRERINSKQDLFYGWKCKQCNKEYKESLLTNVVDVISECNLGSCRPDLALIDNNGNVVSVIEVIVFHKPEPKVEQYYADNKIICIQVKLNSYEDCDDVQKIFANTEKVKLYPQRICGHCDQIVSQECNESQFVELKPTSLGSDQDQLIDLLQRKGYKTCPNCSCELQIQEKWTGEPFLKCPKCDYTQRVDSLLWPTHF